MYEEHTMLNFPRDFRWGAATASYQVEGAFREDGRGESIWDRFTHTPGTILDGTTGDVACDHYHRWEQDIGLMKELGLGAYRFSVAWPRIYPEGRGRKNTVGLDFYARLVDGLLDAGIQPVVTLYHWDLPQALQDTGGWTNRDTADYFTDYAHTVFATLGDRVKMWITLNEPRVISMRGHYTGEMAPGLRDLRSAVSVTHTLNIAHSKAVGVFRSDFARSGEIGITLNLSPAVPETDEDRDAATVADGYLNRWFLDPVLTGGYPEDLTALYTGLGATVEMEEGDAELLAGTNLDFLGVNYYNRTVVRRDAGAPFGYVGVIPEGSHVTEMGWEVYPQGLGDLLARLVRDYNSPRERIPAFYITENGAAYPDRDIVGGIVQDTDRIAYLDGHLAAAWRAIQDGVNLRGYFLWSLMDNFEWAHGVSKRFGIVRTDYDSLRRTVKKSGEWYRRVIATGGLDER